MRKLNMKKSLNIAHIASSQFSCYKIVGKEDFSEGRKEETLGNKKGDGISKYAWLFRLFEDDQHKKAI